MSLVEELRRQSRTIQPGPRCGVERFLSWLPDGARDEWAAIMDDASIHASIISEHASAKLNYPQLSRQMVNYHRGGKCRCSRTN